MNTAFPIGRTAIESVFGRAVEIVDISRVVSEQISSSNPELKIVSIKDILQPHQLLIGFGLPNVYMAWIKDGKHFKLDAKSLFRAPTEIVRTMRYVQSGVFMILDLTPEIIERMSQSAQEQVGEKFISCVHANATALHEAGFSLGDGSPLNVFKIPHVFFKAVNDHGLTFNGKKIDIKLVKTTDKYLESQMFAVKVAVWTTLCRHLKRNIQKKMNRKVSEMSREIETPPLAPQAPLLVDDENHMQDIEILSTNISPAGRAMRLFWGPHAIFSIRQSRVHIDEYFPPRDCINKDGRCLGPDVLQAYPQKNPSLMTKIKKNVLFNPFMVGLINKHLQAGLTSFGKKPEADLVNMLKTHSEQSFNKYNIVITPDEIKIGRIKGSSGVDSVKNSLADWILSKHVLMSNYDKGVRFAGEMWKDEHGVIWINNNSGTYQPEDPQLDSCIGYLQEIFPHLTFRAHFNR